jgi:hypothetical protein
MDNPRVSHPGPLVEIKPLAEEERRGLQKYLSLELEAHQLGVFQRELSEDRTRLHVLIPTLQREMEARQVNIRSLYEQERDRVGFGRRIGVLAMRIEMIDAMLEKINPRITGLRDQRDHVAQALLGVGTLTQREIDGI